MKLTVQQQERIRYACGHLAAAELFPDHANAADGEDHAWEVFQEVMSEAVDSATNHLLNRIRERITLWEQEAATATDRGMSERTSELTYALQLHASQLRKLLPPGEDNG